MNGKTLIRAAAFAAIALTLAACDSVTSSEGGLDPSVAQQVVAERTDPDRALSEKVKKALGTDEGAAYGVEVTANDGRIELWGRVDGNGVRKRFELTAAGVVGVKSVYSHLLVDPGA